MPRTLRVPNRQERSMIRTAIIFAVMASLTISSAIAGDAQVGALKITAAWARATPKGASVGGGYLTVTNTGTTPDRLLGGSSDASKKFELHEMKMDKGVMKMRPLPDGVEIKPGQTVELKPGGEHIMLVGLNRQLMKGDQIKGTLNFEKAGKVDVTFSVAGIGAQGLDGGQSGSGNTKMDMKKMH
jgi:copper(I)-binding protein